MKIRDGMDDSPEVLAALDASREKIIERQNAEKRAAEADQGVQQIIPNDGEPAPGTRGRASRNRAASVTQIRGAT